MYQFVLFYTLAYICKTYLLVAWKPSSGTTKLYDILIQFFSKVSTENLNLSDIRIERKLWFQQNWNAQ